MCICTGIMFGVFVIKTTTTNANLLNIVIIKCILMLIIFENYFTYYLPVVELVPGSDVPVEVTESKGNVGSDEKPGTDDPTKYDK